jgi:hypothetical protein
MMRAFALAASMERGMRADRLVLCAFPVAESLSVEYARIDEVITEISGEAAREITAVEMVSERII